MSSTDVAFSRPTAGHECNPEPKLVIVINPGSASSQVANAVTQAQNHVNRTGGLAVIYFREGTFYLNSAIALNQNHRNIVSLVKFGQLPQ